MATNNPFDLLGDYDDDNPTQLIAAQKEKIVSKKSVTAPKTSAKLPSKPVPPSQAVKEARNEASAAAGRGAGRGRGGAGRGRGGRGSGPPENFASSWSANGVSGEYGDYVDPQAKRPSVLREDFHERQRGEDTKRRPHRQFNRHSGTGRGNEIKREGVGRGNWGTANDEVFAQESAVVADTEDKDLISEKQAKQYDVPTSDANKEEKERVVNEGEEKEPEDKEMTLAEYEKILEEKRKSLLAMKTGERKVDFDREFESMQQLSLKKGSDDVFIKLGSDKDAGRRKETADRDEKVKKPVSINEFLKPAEGERSYTPAIRGRGRGRGDRREFRGGGIGGGSKSSTTAPSIEDPGQFPTLGGK